MKRKCFYSFYYKLDSWIAAQVRNIGKIEGNSPVSDNDWETVKKGGEDGIKRWIANQMNGRTCTVVLVGDETADRKWINYEIAESWKRGMGIVGIYIHGLKDSKPKIDTKGKNPFDFFNYKGKKLSLIVKCYDPSGYTSNKKYAWIADNLANKVEEAIEIRRCYK